MRFRFLAACRQRASDEDRYEKYLRLGRAVWLTGYGLSLGLILDSALDIRYLGVPFDSSPTRIQVFFGAPFDPSPVRILFLYVLSLGAVLSWNGDEAFLKPLPRPRGPLLLVTLLWSGAEAATSFTGWNPGELLGWWRACLLMALAASGFLWASERWVQGRRSRNQPDPTLPLP